MYNALKDTAINLCPSLPSRLLSEDLEQGIVRIREWQKRQLLDISKESILYSQLGKITADNLDDSIFYAIKALHYLVTWYETNDPPQFVEKYLEAKRKAEIEALRASLDNVSRIAMDEFERTIQNLPGGRGWDDDESGGGIPIT